MILESDLPNLIPKEYDEHPLEGLWILMSERVLNLTLCNYTRNCLDI